MLVMPLTPAHAQTDWSRVVNETSAGAYVVGNPAAKTKLVEYMSYTCPHCAHFAAEGMPPLTKGWIATGKASLEFRNFVRDGFDLTAALIARCGGKAHFLGNHDAIFAAYDKWIPKAVDYGKAHAKADAQKSEAQQQEPAEFIARARGTGLSALIAGQGVPAATQQQCLADKTMLATVLELTANAWDNKGFDGTPFFVLDGKPLPSVHDWKSLKPLLPPLPGQSK